MNAGAQLTSFHSVQSPTPWNGASHIQEGLPTSVKPIEKFVSYVIPDQVEDEDKPSQRCQIIQGHAVCKEKSMTDNPEICQQTAELT